MLYGATIIINFEKVYKVLILIFLENALRLYQAESVNDLYEVLILIFLENALRLNLP